MSVVESVLHRYCGIFPEQKYSRSCPPTGVEASGLVNSDGTVGYGQGDDAGVGAVVLVGSNSGADAGWSDDVAGIGLEDSISSGNLVAVGQLEGGIGTGEVRTLDDDKGSVSAGPMESGGQEGLRSYTCNPEDKGSASAVPLVLGNLGVGDGSRSYTCDPNDGDGSRSYTCDPNDGVGSRSYSCDPDDGVRPGHYISGRGGDLRPSDEVSGRDDERDDECDDERDERRFPTTMRRQADSESTTGQADRPQDVSDGAAIAGDPMSSPRLRDRPRRTVKLPLRFADFYMP